VQVAFYGGSFTGLPTGRQQELLGAVAPFVEQGTVDLLRLSTRPDYIDSQRIALLTRYHVGVVELGVQSLDNRVLALSRRGHTAEDVQAAVPRLRQAGLEVGLQLMLGLPGQDRASIRRTVEQAVLLQPDFVRLYPVLVVENSVLAGMYARGVYKPLTLDMAVLLAAWMKKQFDRAGIRVVRMGLQPGRDLEQALVAGPYHPAFGELVMSRLMLARTRKLLAGAGSDSPIRLVINDKDQSVFRGMQSVNIKRLQGLGWWKNMTLHTDPSQPRHTVRRIPDP
jgi:histone acetyltransferase (RNA polymerase elongator complex component)